MKNLGKLLKIFLFIIIVASSLYLFFLFALPSILNSHFIKNKVNNFAYSKIGVEINAEHLHFKTMPALSISASADKIKLNNKTEELLNAKNFNLEFNLLQFALKKIDVEYVYINETGLTNLIKSKEKREKFNFKLDKISEINIKSAEIWFDKGNLNSIFVMITDLHQFNKDNKIYYTFQADIVSERLRNLISIGRSGGLYIENNELYADNLQVLIGVSELTFNGRVCNDKYRNTDLSIKGSDIPISDIMSSLLYFQKLKEPGKKFIENFYDYAGTMVVDLQLKNKGIFGKCSANMLSGTSVLFNVPILFKKVDFIFNERNMKASAYGTLGGEEVFSSVEMSNIATRNQQVEGYVHSNLTNKTVNKYIKDVTVKGIAEASVKYAIKNKIIDVDYMLKLAKDSDIYYKSAYLGLEDKNRRLFVNTVKNNDELKITNYDYSIQDESQVSKIIMGEGLYKKENGHLKPQYLTFKTQNDAPVSVTGSFYKYIEGGYFNGDLKYDFKNEIITGIFNIKNSKYKNFEITNASVDANTAIVKIESHGTYKNSPFKCQITALNKFSNKIKIYDMNLFLDEFIVKKSSPVNKNSMIAKSQKIVKKAKQMDVDIDKWTIKINKIIRRRLVISDINISGNIHNKIFKFNVLPLNFAKGTISANGIYDYANSSSDVVINANNIDSETAADVVFELPNQIEGIANAKLHAKTYNGLDDVKAKVIFSVDNGFLPKLGNTEFLVKKSKMIKRPFKIKLSDVVNIDLQNVKILSSNLKGEFDYDNLKIRNANITSSQKYLALLIQGDYDIVKEQADFSVLGKYNKSKISKIKVFFVPLSLILRTVFRTENTMEQYKEQFKLVPDIDSDIDDECAFRVKVKGNINTNDVKVELKRIK